MKSIHVCHSLRVSGHKINNKQTIKDAGTTALSDIGSQSAGTYFSPNPFNIMILRNLRKFCWRERKYQSSTPRVVFLFVLPLAHHPETYCRDLPRRVAGWVPFTSYIKIGRKKATLCKTTIWLPSQPHPRRFSRCFTSNVFLGGQMGCHCM